MITDKILTVDIGASKVNFQIVDKNGSFGQNHIVSLVGQEMDNDKFIKLVSDNINSLLNPEIAAISIGSPGPVDVVKGVIEDTPNLKGVKNLNIVDGLKKIFKLPIFLLNDADAAGIGEWWLGSGRGAKYFVYITLSTGVGSAFMIDGKLQHGIRKAPEWGHTSLAVENDYRLCNCGRWSCVESFLGTEGLAKTYANAFGLKWTELSREDKHSVSFKMREGIVNNDKNWLKVQDEYIKQLGVLIRNIILVHQPNVITFGGGIAFGNESLLNKANEKLKEHGDLNQDKMASTMREVWLHLAKFENPVNLGAAKYALEQLGELT